MYRLRRFAVVLGALVLAGTVVGPALPTSQQSRAAAAPQLVAAAPDFATDAFADPWDYSNAADILLDNTGPAGGLAAASMSGGLLSVRVAGPSYLSPLWGGYHGSLRLGRDGALPQNMVHASYYTTLHLHAYASQKLSVALNWFSCPQTSVSCRGGMPFGLQAGWNDVNLVLRNSPHYLPHGVPWAGNIQGVQLAMAPRSSTVFMIDYLRLDHPTPAAQLSWASPDSAPATLWWSDGSPFTPVASQHATPIAQPGSSGAGNTVRADLSGYPPNSAFYAVSRSGQSALVGRTVGHPLPVIDSPSMTGCGDYATHTLGHPWTFTSARSIAGYGNLAGLSFTRSGELTATNAGPHRNDPYVWLPLARGGLNGRVYHRLTIVESYDGPFNLANRPGGGTMGRFIWQEPGQRLVSQTAPILTYSGLRTIYLDMGAPANVLTDASGAPGQRYPFAAAVPVTRLRWDPNEDPGTRRWHLFSVRLATDCATRTKFAMQWHDAQFAAGSTVTIAALAAGRAPVVLARNVPERAGENVFAVNARALPTGSWTLQAVVTGALGQSFAARASGPLVIVR